MRSFVVLRTNADFGHSQRRPTSDELTAWFVENYDRDIEYHAEYFKGHSSGLEFHATPFGGLSFHAGR